MIPTPNGSVPTRRARRRRECSTGCTRAELVSMLRMMEATGLRPKIDRVIPLQDIHAGFQAMIDGDVNGKVVVKVS